MLVVTANWALGDETLVRSSGWHAALPAAVHRGAIRGGFRGNGTYQPIDAVDLVIAGDTFDWLVSAGWCGGSRPWHGDAAARDTLLGIARGSLRSGRRLLARVAGWAHRGIAVPIADPRGRPGGRMVAVPVRVTLLVGDRDAALADVARHLPRQPFAVGETWSDDSVTIRHGHEFDPTCRRADDDTRASGSRPPTLAESVGVDLVVPFAVAVRRLAPALPGVERLLRGLVGSSPVDIPLTIAAWRADVDRGGSRCVEQIGLIAATWRRTVAAWCRAARRVVPACESEFDAVDCLAGWLDAAFSQLDEPVVVPVGIDRLRPRAPFHDGGPGAIPLRVAGRPLVLGHLDNVSGDGVASAPLGLAAGPSGFRRVGPVPHVIAARRQESVIRWEAIMGEERRPSIVTIAPSGWSRGNAIVDAA